MNMKRSCQNDKQTNKTVLDSINTISYFLPSCLPPINESDQFICIFVVISLSRSTFQRFVILVSLFFFISLALSSLSSSHSVPFIQYYLNSSTFCVMDNSIFLSTSAVPLAFHFIFPLYSLLPVLDIMRKKSKFASNFLPEAIQDEYIETVT